MKVEILNEKPIQKEPLPQVIDRIFSICKTDPHFKLKVEMEQVEERNNSIKDKVKRQINLLEQSDTLTENVRKRIILIQLDNESRQSELLENLGSEL